MPTTRATPTVASPINLMTWVEEARKAGEFKPPVSNKYLYDGEDFFVMMIGGPNARNDFHMTNSDEFFYQVKGDIVVRVIEDAPGSAPGTRPRIRDVVVREGETIFIPGNVPHSPTRPPGTLGMVVERRRPEGETEHLQFYCDNCHELVQDLEFDCKDIVQHFSQAMKEFWADEELSTCRNCGTRVPPGKPVKRIVVDGDKVTIEREI